MIKKIVHQFYYQLPIVLVYVAANIATYEIIEKYASHFHRIAVILIYVAVNMTVNVILSSAITHRKMNPK